MGDGKSHLHYPSIPASSCLNLCKHGKKNDSLLAKMNVAVSRNLSSSEIPDKNFSLKKGGTARARRKGEEFVLRTAFQTDDNSSCCSGVINMALLQHSDASSDLIECMSEESVNMKPKTPPRFLENIRTYEQNSHFFEDGSLVESTLVVPDEVTLTFNENPISIDDVPWACSDGFSVESAAMELESPPSALESMASTLTSHDHKLEESSVEFQVSLAAGELPDHVKEPSNRFRTVNQENIRRSMTRAMASSSRDTAGMKPKQQKQMNGLKVDEKQRMELLPVKTSLLGRVEAKKKVDAVVEPSTTDEKSSNLIRNVKSVKPIQFGAMPDNGTSTSFSPIIIKKKTLSPPKKIQLSPKQSLLLKNKSSVIEYRSPILDSGRSGCRSSRESSKNAYNADLSKVGDKKILKQVTESLVPKPSINFAPVLNNRKARSVKKQVEAGNVDGVEQKLICVAHKSTEQKNMKLRALQSSRTLSSGSSTSSSAFVSSICDKEGDGSRLTDANVSKKSHIGERERRTQLHVVEQKPIGAVTKFAEHKHTKLRNLSSRSSVSSSAFVLSGHGGGNGASRLTVSHTSGSKNTHIGERTETTPLHVVEQKLVGVAVMTDEQKNKMLRPQLSSRTSSFRSSISSPQSLSSSYEEENDESQLTVSETSGSKETQTDEGDCRTPLWTKKGDEEKIQKKTENLHLENKSFLISTSVRRGQEVLEAQNFEGEPEMNNFKESRESAKACSGTVSPGLPAAVLRCQAVEEKNTQAFSNDLIEETAPELVEPSKSKVKALVSAFEGIISLQQRTVL